MGMFDYIRCEVALPDGWVAGELQTKDFDCEMITHVISKDGRLLFDRGGWEAVPLLQRRLWRAAWGDSEQAEKDHVLEAAFGSMRRVPNYQDENFHGLVNFYGHDKDDQWHEYNAKFTDGQLTEIVLAQ
jgi:hypothetical protein